MDLDELKRLKQFERRFESRLARGERRRLRHRRPDLLLVRILLIGVCLLLLAVIVEVIRFVAS